MSRGLHTVTIGDLDINFPFEPYTIQKDLMAKVVECIKTKSNGLLESPTGTGKTLSLLCAAIAWQRKEKESYRTMVQSAQAKLPLQSSNAVIAAFEPPKIIYASRTHSQLSQAVLELKRSHYNDSKAIVLGSRDVLCIHEEVQRIQNSAAKIAACHAKVQRHICTYYNNTQPKKDDAMTGTTVVDIEDIVKKGKAARFCPFYMSREVVKTADVVFMPYNYILDPKIRSTHGIDLNNSIIILDEGHNIPKLCEDAVSFDIRSSHIALVISEVTRAMNYYKEQAEGGESVSTGLTKDLSLHNILNLKQLFLSLEQELDKVQGHNQPYFLPGDTFVQILSSAGFTSQVIPRITSDLDLVGTFLTGSSYEATGCDKFVSILRILNSNSHQKTFIDSYKVYVELEPRKDGRRDWGKSLEKPAKIFNFWCFNPSVGLETLTRFGPRSIILASGTLCPIPFLKEELSIPFPVQLTNPHIIQDNQLFVGVLKTGPRNATLSSSFENREKPEYLADLGESIAKICSLVPGGVLVFFPSYYVMDSCARTWRENGLMSAITQYKKVLIEPRGSESFKQVLDEYYAAVRAGGGCLMAVCRGKVSEGLDFTDDYGRAVILTGIPYSPAKDPKILAKRQYLDTKSRTGGATFTISGSKWYQLEATRALNQAIGRIIRHAQDYGAILFCDARCDEFNFKSSISQWVSRQLKSYTKFSEGMNDLAKFFGTSVQQERQAFVQKQKKTMEPNLEKFKLAKYMSFLDDTTDEDLHLFYSSQPGDDTLNLSRVTIPEPSSSRMKDEEIEVLWISSSRNGALGASSSRNGAIEPSSSRNGSIPASTSRNGVIAASSTRSEAGGVPASSSRNGAGAVATSSFRNGAGTVAVAASSFRNGAGSVVASSSRNGVITALSTSNGTIAASSSRNGAITASSSSNGTIAASSSRNGAITASSSSNGTIAASSSRNGAITASSSSNGAVAGSRSKNGALAPAPSSSKSTLGSKGKPIEKKSTLFEDLEAYSNQQKAHAVSRPPPPPIYSPLTFPGGPSRKSSTFRVEGLIAENPRKRLKVTSSCITASNTKKHGHSTKPPIQGSQKNETDSTGFETPPQYWKWVKLTLSNEKYNKYIRAIKQLRNTMNIKDFAPEMVDAFKVELIPTSLKGMSLILSAEQFKELKTNLRSLI